MSISALEELTIKMLDEPKWKRFEKLVAKVQSTLAQDARVTLNEKVKGIKSGTLREIDVSVRKNIGQYDLFIAIECKDTNKPANVKDIEESIGLFQDVGAHKGAIVSAKGFTRAAKERGAKAGLNLYRLVDAEDHDWKAFVSIPVLFHFIEPKSYHFEISSQSVQFDLSSIDPRYFVLFDENKKRLGTPFELLLLRWDQLEVPIEPGELSKFKLVAGKTYLLHENIYYEVMVWANILVEQRSYFGTWPIDEVSGFSDELRGGLITKSFKTAPLDLFGVEKTWQRIESEESLAVKPVITMYTKLK